MSSDSAFIDLIADAYEHLYDLVYLRTHPLAEVLLPGSALPPKDKAWALHQRLIEAIEELNPGAQAPASSPEWRRYRLMGLRYVDGLDPQAVAERLCFSRRTYYRELKEAIEAIAQVLRDQQAPSAQPAPCDEHLPPLNQLQLLRLEAARLARAEQYAPLAQVISGTLELVSELAKGKGLALRADLPEAEGQTLVDRNTVRQVLLSILSYLVGRLATGQVRIHGAMETQHVGIVVTGEGIWGAPAPLDLNETEPRLSLLGELARAQAIELETLQEGHEVIGFKLQLPRTPTRTVLVADDSEDTLQLLRRYLLQHGYQAVMAHTGTETINLARRLRPYAVTLDLMMPEQDGWDVLQALTNDPDTQDIPVIVCTVLSAQELALSLGAACFLPKPVSEQTLISALEALGEEKRGMGDGV